MSETKASGKIGGLRIFIAAILFVAAFALIGHNSDRPFIKDQSVQRVFMSKLPAKTLVTSCPDQRNPFLYMLTVKWAADIAGNSEAAARLPGVLFAAGCVALVYLLLSLRVSQPLAICGALLTMVSPQIVEQGREITTVTIFTFFSLLSTHLLFRTLSLRRRGKPIVFSAACYLVSSFLMACSNYFFMFVLAAHTVYLALLFFYRRASYASVVLKLQMVSWFLSIPLFMSAYRGFVGDFSARKLASDIPSAIWGGKTALGYLSEAGTYFFMMFGPHPSFLYKVCAVVLLITLFFMLHDGRLFRRGLPTVGALLILITVASNVFIVPYARLQTYYIVFLVPFAWSAWIIGLESFSAKFFKPANTRNVFLALVIVVSLAFQAQLLMNRVPSIYGDTENLSVRSLVEHMEKSPDKAGPILIEHYYTGWMLLYYGENEKDISFEDVFSNINPRVDDDGLVRYEGAELNYMSVRPWKNIIDENDMYRKELDNFDRIGAARFRVILERKSYYQPLKERMGRYCDKTYENEGYELFYCEKDDPAAL